MRLNGETYDGEDGEEEEQKLVVGYALTLKKKKSFLQPKFERLARKKGILFVAIDLNRPLSDQGPFDIILQKLSGREWCEIIENFALLVVNLDQIVETGIPMIGKMKWVNSIWHFEGAIHLPIAPLFAEWNCSKNSSFGVDYRQTHPGVTVLDPPDAIQHLQNRQSMLQDVVDLNLSDFHGKVGVPRQMVITENPLSIPDEVSKAGLKLPLVAKPLLVDGSTKSHELFLAYDQLSLSELEPPLILQEFVNHGGVLFKIYVVGDAINVVRRRSLANFSKLELAKDTGISLLPRVSSAAASGDDADLDPGVAELPPRPLLERLAKELRHRMGLRLFNIDMIREHGTKDIFYVIDINYFPGYGKMPDYEHIFTDFLLSFMQSKYKRHAD